MGGGVEKRQNVQPTQVKHFLGLHLSTCYWKTATCSLHVSLPHYTVLHNFLDLIHFKYAQYHNTWHKFEFEDFLPTPTGDIS